MLIIDISKGTCIWMPRLHISIYWCFLQEASYIFFNWTIARNWDFFRHSHILTELHKLSTIYVHEIVPFLYIFFGARLELGRFFNKVFNVFCVLLCCRLWGTFWIPKPSRRWNSCTRRIRTVWSWWVPILILIISQLSSGGKPRCSMITRSSRGKWYRMMWKLLSYGVWMSTNLMTVEEPRWPQSPSALLHETAEFCHRWNSETT